MSLLSSLCEPLKHYSSLGRFVKLRVLKKHYSHTTMLIIIRFLLFRNIVISLKKIWMSFVWLKTMFNINNEKTRRSTNFSKSLWKLSNVNRTLLVDRVSLAQLRMKRRNRHTVISVLGNHNLSTGFMRDCHVWLAIVTYDYSRRRIHTGEQQCRIPSVRCVWPVSVGERRARLPGVFSCPPPSTILM